MLSYARETIATGLCVAALVGCGTPEQGPESQTTPPDTSDEFAISPEQAEIIQNGFDTARAFWQQRLGSFPVSLVTLSGSERFTCDGEEESASSFSLYCAESTTIVVTARATRQDYDLATRFVPSHEVGHRVQDFQDLPYDEVQATCLAGYELNDSLSREDMQEWSESLRSTEPTEEYDTAAHADAFLAGAENLDNCY